MTAQGFASKERLHRGRDFVRAYDTGLRIRRRGFTMRVVVNGLAWSRLGLAVGRRIGPAHVRTLVKRRIRDVFRRNKDRTPGGWDLVLTAQPAVAALSYQDLRAEFLGALGEAGRKCSQPRSRSGSPSGSSAATS